MTTDEIRLKIAKAVQELGIAMQHLDQADEDREHGASPLPELAEARECIDGANFNLCALVGDMLEQEDHQ